MAVVQTQVGPIVGADGTTPPQRAGRYGDLIVSEFRGRYAEVASRGQVFCANLIATTGTIAAGNITGAAAAAVTQFAVWNPVNSKVNLELLKFICNPISGTAPGGPVQHTVSINGVPNANIGSSGINTLSAVAGGFARVVASAAGVALTGGAALPAIPLRASHVNLFAAALAATTSIMAPSEDIGGDIVLAPGTLWIPTWTAAGTTFLNGYSLVWAEIAV